jgi:hypothetical protein
MVLSAVAAAAQADPVLTATLKARSIRPGELVLLTLTSSETLERVAVSVFNRRITAFDLDEGRRWGAMVGVDLDQRPGRYTVVVEGEHGGALSQLSQELVVVRRSFPTRTLRVEPDFVNPSPALVTRIEQEQQFTRSVYATSAAERLWTLPFVRPVPQPAHIF